MRLEAMYADYSHEMQGVMKANDVKNLAFFFTDQAAHDATFAPQPAPPTGAVFWAPDPNGNDSVGPRLVMHRSIDNIHYEMTRLVQHEGWHQFNWNHVAEYSPVWLDEGLAVYYSFGVWTGDMTVYGGLLPDYFNMLADGINHPEGPRLKPLIELMAMSDAGWREWQDDHGFWAPYMQSWSVIQFLKHADGGAHQHLLDAYIADLAAGADATDSARAIVDLQDRWGQWLLSLTPTSTHGRYFEAIAAILAGHLARAQLNGQTFESMDAFLAAAYSGELQLGPVGSDTWLPPSVMEECKRTVEYFRDFYAAHGAGTLELALEHTSGVPTARVTISQSNIDVRATAKITDGKVTGVTITHVTPLPQQFD